MSNIEPSIQEVGTIIRSRTRDTQSGAQTGTFSTKTNPNAEQAKIEIENAMAEVLTDIGTTQIPDSVAPEVKGLVAMLTCANIEMSYFAEQVAANKSPYQMLITRYEKRLPRVVKAVERAFEGDTEDTIVELSPMYSFPDGSDPQGMIGWGTRLG